jgi:uncharacterized membrane protein YraQ (UPF0718 family)
LVVLSFVALAVGGLVLVQRLVPIKRRLAHNDVAGFIYAVLGVAYAVLLGLMVVAVWQDWQAAQEAATQEANELAAVFWLAHGLPEPEARHIQGLARSYARVEVHEEWPLMERGKSSPKAYELLDEMRASVEALRPADAAQTILYDNLLQRLHELGDARRARLLEAEEGLPALLWAVLLVGGAIRLASPTSSACGARRCTCSWWPRWLSSSG